MKGRQPIYLLGLTTAFAGLIGFMSYGLIRTNFTQLLIGYVLMFALYILMIQHAKSEDISYRRVWLPILILVHFIPVLALPNLSDDYFRFVWDARLFAMGINPFDHKPISLISQLDPSMLRLSGQLNSMEYYSVYPPWNQAVFQLGVSIFPENIYGSVVVMKSLLAGSQLAGTYFVFLLARQLNLPRETALWYGLNPLVVLELSGNLHFESLMITMLLLCLLLIIRGNIVLAAFAFSGAVLSKLHPLMLLPFIVKYLGWRKGGTFTVSTAIFIFMASLPFTLPLDQSWNRLANIGESLSLYYQTFEFNAGIYNVFRWIGYHSYGYYNIDVVGKVMATFTLLALVYYWITMKADLYGMVLSWYLAYLAYILFSTTVHPWYILPLLPLALLLRMRMPIGWSGLIVLSYFAYSQLYWHENFYLLALEYTCIFVLLYFDLKSWRNQRAKIST